MEAASALPSRLRAAPSDPRLRRVWLLLACFTAAIVVLSSAQLVYSPRPIALRLLAGALLLLTAAIPVLRAAGRVPWWAITGYEAVVIATAALALPVTEGAIPLVYAIAAQQSLVIGSLRRTLVAVGLDLLGYIGAQAILGVVAGEPQNYLASFGAAPGLLVTAASIRLLVDALAARGRAEELAKQAGSQLATLIETSPVGLVHLDAVGRVRLYNAAAQRLLGPAAQSLLGVSPAERFNPSSEGRALLSQLMHGEMLSDYEFTTGGTSAPNLSVSSAPVRTESGESDGVMIVISDVTERTRLEEELRRRALYDELTGLANRTLFGDRTAQALRAARPGTQVGVLLLDLDEFQTVNNSLGHAAGDRLLASVAGRLGHNLRPSDTVARIGGDEFGVLLPNATEPEAVRVAERIAASLAEPVSVEGRDVSCRASMGIAMTSAGSGTPAADLFRDATAAMHVAKRGEGLSVFQSGMREASMARLELEGDLRRGLGLGELVVHYQPAVDLRSGQVRGVEALVRWNHPERGLLLPESFIGLAEDTGLILPLGRQVLEHSCAQMVEWLHRYPVVNFLMSVNVSPRQLRDPGFVQDVTDVLTRTSLPARHLALEITESLLADDDAESTLYALKQLGVSLALDDFGTGYSALAYLQKFPIDIVKIDRSFVARLDRGEQAAALARAVIDLAHALQMTTVGEGVETEEQATLLRDLGCGIAQGFYFARPAPPAALDAYVEGTGGLTRSA